MPEAPTDRELGVLRSLARRIDPSDPGAHNNLGVLYYERAMVSESMAAFARALELDPHMRVAQENLETVQRETGSFDRRITELRDLIGSRPADQQLRLELGRAYLALGQFDRAGEQFEEMLRIRPEDGSALVQLGLLEQARSRHDLAGEWFQRAAQIDPDSAVVRYHLGQSHYNRGLVDAALAVLTEAAQLNPEYADIHYLLGFVYGDLGYHDAARAATRRAIVLNPSLANAQANLRIGPRRPAPKATRLVATEAAPEAHLSLAVAFRRRGYFVEALREYRLALEACEDERPALEGMAEIHLLQRETQPALDLYARLIDRHPGAAKFWNERGVVLHQVGRRQEARDAYEEAVRLDPEEWLAWNNLGVLRSGDADVGSAAVAFETAIAGRPDFEAARLNLALLQFQRRRLQAAGDTACAKCVCVERGTLADLNASPQFEARNHCVVARQAAQIIAAQRVRA